MSEPLSLMGFQEVTWNGPQPHTLLKLSQAKSFLISPVPQGDKGKVGAGMAKRNGSMTVS